MVDSCVFHKYLHYNIYSSFFTFSPRALCISTPWFFFCEQYLFMAWFKHWTNFFVRSWKPTKSVVWSYFRYRTLLAELDPLRFVLWICRDWEWWSRESFVRAEWRFGDGGAAASLCVSAARCRRRRLQKVALARWCRRRHWRWTIATRSRARPWSGSAPPGSSPPSLVSKEFLHSKTRSWHC